jgi:phenylalanyl-tRNA synthetase beta chain
VRTGVVDAPVWAGPVWALEIRLPNRPDARAPISYRALPRFPGVERDVALLIRDGVPAWEVSEEIIKFLHERKGMLEDVRVFDSFRGQGIEANHRSVAFRLRFRAPERTLKDEEVGQSVQAVLGHLKEKMGVQVRA